MMLALVGLGFVSFLELLLWLGPLWRLRKALAPVLLAALALASSGLLIEHLSTWAVLLAVISLYRCLNLSRITAGRVQADYLYHSSRQTSFWLIGIQLIIVVLAGINYQYHGNALLWWYLLAAAQLICAAILLGSTLRHLRTTKPPKIQSSFAEADLPTLTVAIPARNETTDLEDCLKSLTASTYPKLEILVLDDCSQNKRTPEIIRGFAQAGVRFIAGTAPASQWLAKNHAYAQLAGAANSEMLLFCGVDTRFQPESLDRLVKTLLQKRKTMLGILPRNLLPEPHSMASWLIQPSRYAWELALPRRLLQRPPVLSTCWLITRQALEAAGGFQAVRRKGVPESYFARAAAQASDGYSFLQADANIGISSQKSPDEQRATAVRTRYLQLHRRPELVALVGLAELFTLVWPPILLLASLIGRQWLLAGISGLSFVMTSYVYSRIVNLTYRRWLVRGTWLLPLAALYDIGLLNYSMWQYEFREVLWKGRNVCIPVMRVIPQLPKI